MNRRNNILAAIVFLTALCVALPCISQEDEQFAANLEGRKTWTFRYGFGDSVGLGVVGLTKGRLSLEQSLAIDLTAEAMGIFSVEGHFNDQLSDSLQSLTIRLDTTYVDGEFGDFRFDGLSGLSSFRRKALGGRLDIRIGDARLTAVACQFEGILESRTFVGGTTEGTTLFAAIDPDRPWVEQPYSRDLAGVLGFELLNYYVPEISTVELVLEGTGAVAAILEAYGVGELKETLESEPRTKIGFGAFVVVEETPQVLILRDGPRELVRRRLEDAIDAVNDAADASEELLSYPFSLGSDTESSFLDALAADASLRVDGIVYPLSEGVGRRYFDLGNEGVVLGSLAVEVSLDGDAFESISRPEYGAYKARVFPAAGILEVDFPDAFFEEDEAAIRASYTYSVGTGSYMLGFSIVPGSERVTVNGVEIAATDYEIDYEFGLLILPVTEITSTDVVQIEYERFGSGLGRPADYARYFYGLVLDVPFSEAVDLTAAVLHGVDDQDSVTEASKVKSMPNRQLMTGVLGTVHLDDFAADFSLGYGSDEFPPDVVRPRASNQVTAIAAVEDSTFVGHRSGFSVLHEGTWRDYSVADGLAGQEIRTFLVAEDRVYIGTDGGLTVVSMVGLSPFDRVDTWSRYREPHGLGDPSVRGLALREGRLWIASDSALFSVPVDELDDPQAWQTETLPELSAITTLHGTAELLYLGTTGGAYTLDPETGTTDSLGGTSGWEIHAINGADGVVYVASERGLRGYRDGVGTGWITVDEAVYSVAAGSDHLYYGTGEGLIEANSGETLFEDWRITALAIDAEGTLWAGSRADADYELFVWHLGDGLTVYDNDALRIDGRDPVLFGEMLPGEYTAEGFFGRGSFEHETDDLELSGTIDVLSPGYRSLGGSSGSGSTAWKLNALAYPFYGTALRVRHEFDSLRLAEGQTVDRTENVVTATIAIGPVVNLMFRQEGEETDPFLRGPESSRLAFQTSVNDSLFSDLLDVSVSWRGERNTDRETERSGLKNTLSADAQLRIGSAASIHTEFRRPLQLEDEAWDGYERWALGGDWRMGLALGSLKLDGEVELSRVLPDGSVKMTTLANAKLNVVAFDLLDWRLTPSGNATFKSEEDEIDLGGRATIRSEWSGLSLRWTLEADATGLRSAVTHIDGSFSVGLSYSGSENWRPSLTYSVDRSDTIQHGVGEATTFDHSLVGSSTWTGEDVSNTLSFSLRVRDVASGQSITGTLAESYVLDLTELLGLRSSTAEAEGLALEIEPVETPQTPSDVAASGEPTAEDGSDVEAVTPEDGSTEALSDAPETSTEAFPTVKLRIDANGDLRILPSEMDIDLSLGTRLDIALSETWSGALAATYLTGTRRSGDPYHSFTIELTIAVDF